MCHDTLGPKANNKRRKGWYFVTKIVADFVYTSESNESCEKHSTQR